MEKVGTSPRIDRYVHQFRTEIFGRSSPPFDSLDDAVVWLEKTSSSGRTQDYRDRVALLEKTFRDVSNQVIASKEGFPFGISISVGIEQDLVAFPRSDGWTYRVLATTPELVRLARASEEIAKVKRCNPAQATMLVLTGTSIRVKLRTRRSFTFNEAGTSAAVSIESHDESNVRASEVADAWKLVRQGHSFPLKDEYFLEVVKLLREQGIEPPGRGRKGVRTGIREYWTKFVEEWNSRLDLNDGKPYGHWTSAQDYFDSVQERIRISRTRPFGILAGFGSPAFTAPDA